MSVSPSDLTVLKSAASLSTGGAATATEIVSGVKNNLWPQIADADRVAGIVVRRKEFVQNDHATDSYELPAYWYVQPAGCTMRLAVGFNDADDDDYLTGNMTAFAANAVVGLISDGADTRGVTVVGLDAAGNPLEETVTLTGAVEVLTTGTFSKVYACNAASESASRTITVRQGAGGTTRGTIAPNRQTCFLWMAAISLASAIKRVDLVAGAAHGLWVELTVPPGASAIKPAVPELHGKELI